MSVLVGEALQKPFDPLRPQIDTDGGSLGGETVNLGLRWKTWGWQGRVAGGSWSLSWLLTRIGPVLYGDLPGNDEKPLLAYRSWPR